ncbi:type II toxin-antitoxin system prevent-host-death family antitoxin [Rhizobium sp. CNPSo 3490]|nr:type II toxin-antitoxin system prevent-host-death family antitoxin [Rhizobium sp. CNPSo 3490]MDK4731089.1 type II toxin-antitoxin system prevent-host-death family antitoxin [Rhizobium sp. CNPSo 3490]
MATFGIMKTVSIRDAKNRLTELAREVEAGETIVITASPWRSDKCVRRF